MLHVPVSNVIQIKSVNVINPKVYTELKKQNQEQRIYQSALSRKK